MKVSPGALRDVAEAQMQLLAAAGASGRIGARDAGFWSDDPAVRALVANRLGWLDVATQMRARVDDLTGFARQIREEGYRDAVLCGMGGSSLAPEVLWRSFGHQPGWPRLHVLDTTDPVTIAGASAAIDPARTLFFVSSKSGTTIEALSLFAHFFAQVQQAKPEAPGANFVAVTDAGTPLQALASEHGFRRVFTNPGDIGGRYSALSYFGLVPAAVMGLDVGLLLDRGIAAEHAAAESNSEAMRLGATLGALALAGRDKATFVVSPGIAAFGLWVEQLIAESTGKHGRGILPVAGEPLGTARSYAEDRLFVQLRLEADSNGEEDAAVAAMVAERHPAISLDLGDRYDLAREFVRWEYAVAVAGRVLGINPFDEPNVQESKDNTNRVLAEFASSKRLDVADVRADAISFVRANGAVTEDAAALTELLASVPDGGYLAITAYIPATDEAQTAFRQMRSMIMGAHRCATTLGFGPRFLHSTGQLHKGGPPVGVFLQVTADDARDVAIPGRAFSFGQLKRAQALGDFESLHTHGRPVLRAHLGSDAGAGLAALTAAMEHALATRSTRR